MASVRASQQAQQRKSHHDHWGEALDKALENASDLGRKGTFDVEVTFSATVEVTNPGRILAYHATLTDTSNG
jgi:hypothetical protein